jgi:hypothetical protein
MYYYYYYGDPCSKDQRVAGVEGIASSKRTQRYIRSESPGEKEASGFSGEEQEQDWEVYSEETTTEGEEEFVALSAVIGGWSR